MQIRSYRGCTSLRYQLLQVTGYKVVPDFQVSLIFCFHNHCQTDYCSFHELELLLCYIE
ncbi:Uncharacterised protein [Vibrio cholerae]|nr:Uncharacterised protein [Vibrio cholerae]